MGKPLESTPDMAVEQKELVVSWGSKLREVRGSRKIALEDIADELHLELSTLKNIEAEDLDNLPSAPFVKGYLRNYARILDVDHKPIIDAYNQVCGEDAPGLALVTQVKETSSSDKAPRYATWALATVMVVSFLIWWWSEILSSGVDEEAQMSDAAEEEVTLPATPGINTRVIVETSVEESFDVESSEGVNTEVLRSEQDVSMPVTEQVADIASMSLQFEGDSWVEITDARGERLFFDLGKTGQTSTVEGLPPIKVLLGNSPAVTMHYKGALFDHRVYEKNGIARFTVDKE